MEDSKNRRRRIDDEVAQTIESLKALENIDAGPYFYSRLQARLQEALRPDEPALLRIVFAGPLAPSLLALIVVLNIFTAVVIFRNARDRSSVPQSTAAESLGDQFLMIGTSSGPGFSGE